ncbi:MAG: hypothetical protein FJX74_03050 [Armatimonadetes bacterium]|nr:hypothetical protein [Armatimonadota bacterium]
MHAYDPLLLLLCAAVPTVGWSAGQALDLAHPVMDWQIDPARRDAYEAAVERVMAMSEPEVLAFVPQWTLVQYCECPQCYGGVEGNAVFTWTIDRPDEMTCRFCQTVFPNAEYPETATLTGRNLLGEEITLPCHEGSQDGAPHFLSTHLQLLRRAWLLSQVDALARAYAVTLKEPYARRVALILDAFAERYPHYPVLQNLPRRITFREQKAPWPWDSGRWNFFHNNIPIALLPAYDLVYASPELDRLSRERGYDVRERVERDFLKPSCEEVMLRTDHVNNCVGYDVRSAAVLGRVIKEPRYVHWACGWMRRNLTEGFMRDGFWKEGTHSYHAMTVGGLTHAFDAVRGYSDPPGYVDAQDGTRYDGLDPEREFPFWDLCRRAPEAVCAPNGIAATFHDTHPNERRAAPREATVSALLPAVGHASLGRGRGENQLQAQLHFSGAYGHQHYDNLTFTLWAKGREMLPDLGYTWTQMRCWTTSTVAHNTVVLNRRDQGGYPSDGNLLAYHPGDVTDPESLEPALVEADGRLGYAGLGGVELYQRTLMLIPVSAADAYVVDVFRVRGGRLQDWALHGDADEDVTVACSLPLGEPQPNLLLPDEAWVEPQQEAHTYPPYGMLRDMRPAVVEGAVQLDFAYAGASARGYRLHVLPCGGAQLWLGRAPSVRRMGSGSHGDMRKAYEYWMPMALLRREGLEPLDSLYVAVHEPWSERPFLEAVEPLALAPSSEFATALRVRHGDTVDTILSTNDTAPYPDRATASGIVIRGRFAVVRQAAGRPTGAWLFDGGRVEGEGLALAVEAPEFAGELVGSTREADGGLENALVTRAELPAGAESGMLEGRWIIVTYPTGLTQGYELARVEARGGQTLLITRQDHGLRIGTGRVEETYAPLRRMEGQCRFRLAGMASTMGGG